MRPLILATAGAAVLLATAVVASPLKVQTPGTKSQTVLMCEDCKSKVACARVGDYTIGLTVDLENPKLGTGRLAVHVQDRQKKPVTDARVTVALAMPDHKHGGKPVSLTHDRHGMYSASTQNLRMPGRYVAEVAVTLASGDTVKQKFGFTR